MEPTYLAPSKANNLASLIAQLVKNPPAMQETPVRVLGREDLLKRDRLPTPVFLGFPCGSDGKESACNSGDLGLIPGLGRFPGEKKGYPLQYSGLENSMDSPRARKKLDTTERLSVTSYTEEVQLDWLRFPVSIMIQFNLSRCTILFPSLDGCNLGDIFPLVK